MKVRLYRRESGIWWASWAGGAGRTIRRSTRSSSEEEARRVVESWGGLPSLKQFKFDEVGVVYFLEAEGTSRVKIGWTRTDKLEKRIADLQIGCPVRLRLLATFSGLMFHEHQEHARFASEWVHGEWFQVSDALRTRIDELRIREPRADRSEQDSATSGETEQT